LFTAVFGYLAAFTVEQRPSFIRRAKSYTLSIRMQTVMRSLPMRCAIAMSDRACAALGSLPAGV